LLAELFGIGGAGLAGGSGEPRGKGLLVVAGVYACRVARVVDFDGRCDERVDEGAHVFISGWRNDALDEAVKLIGRNVTGVQADSADLADLDRLFETVKEERA